MALKPKDCANRNCTNIIYINKSHLHLPLICGECQEVPEKRTVKYGNMTLEDSNGDGSWWHCIDCEVDFSLSREELKQRGIIV